MPTSSQEGQAVCLTSAELLEAPNPKGATVQGSLMREALILRPGVYNGHTFTAQDCRDYASNYDPADPPPLIKDHDLTNADNCFGYLRGLRFDEATQSLVGLVEVLGNYAQERVADKRWKRLSGRFVVSKNPKNRVLTELSITMQPAFKGAVILSQQEHEATLARPYEPFAPPPANPWAIGPSPAAVINSIICSPAKPPTPAVPSSASEQAFAQFFAPQLRKESK